MSRIKSNDTKPEKFVRSLLFKHGFRYRIHHKDICGKPDLYFPRYKVAVFVHGCFWHGHPDCKVSHNPKTNTGYWNPKLNRNIERDQKVVRDLNECGIRVLIIWECTVKEMKKNAQKHDEIYEKAREFIVNGNALMLEL